MAKIEEPAERIAIEFMNLERLAGELNDLLIHGNAQKSSVEVRAAGSILHDFYCGMEKIFERIAILVDHAIPEGMNWHTDLQVRHRSPNSTGFSKTPAVNSTLTGG